MAGGWARSESRVLFFLRVHSLLRSSDRVLDFGAGRGRSIEAAGDGPGGRLVRLRGRCADLVRFDVDPAVLDNPFLDRAAHAPPGQPLPFSDASFDMIVSLSALELVEEPEFDARELDRVLRPGGRFCACTPGAWR